MHCSAVPQVCPYYSTVEKYGGEVHRFMGGEVRWFRGGLGVEVRWV